MFRGLLTIVLPFSGVAFLLPAAAHSNLSEYVQHDITLEAGATYIDLTARLIFFDRHAALQELFLDSDGDGRFSEMELKAFRNDVLREAEARLTLLAGTESLALIPLYAPEIVGASPETAPGHHRRFEVRLKFFARLPAAPAGELALEVRDGLYPAFPALAGFHVAGKDGIRVVADSGGQALSRPAGAPEPMALTGRLTRAARPAPDEVHAGDRSLPISTKAGETP